MVGAVFNALAQNVYDAAAGNFTFQSCQELASSWTIFVKRKGTGSLRLCCAQEGGELLHVCAVLTIIIVRGTADPADAAIRCGWFVHRSERYPLLVLRDFRKGVIPGWVTRSAGQRGRYYPFQTAFGGVSYHVLILRCSDWDLLLMLENRCHLPFLDLGVPFQKLFYCGASLQVFKEGVYRHSRSSEGPSSADLAGVAFHRGAICPVRHECASPAKPRSTLYDSDMAGIISIPVQSRYGNQVNVVRLDFLRQCSRIHE